MFLLRTPYLSHFLSLTLSPFSLYLSLTYSIVIESAVDGISGSTTISLAVPETLVGNILGKNVRYIG